MALVARSCWLANVSVGDGSDAPPYCPGRSARRACSEMTGPFVGDFNVAPGCWRGSRSGWPPRDRTGSSAIDVGSPGVCFDRSAALDWPMAMMLRGRSSGSGSRQRRRSLGWADTSGDVRRTAWAHLRDDRCGRHRARCRIELLEVGGASRDGPVGCCRETSRLVVVWSTTLITATSTDVPTRTRNTLSPRSNPNSMSKRKYSTIGATSPSANVATICVAILNHLPSGALGDTRRSPPGGFGEVGLGGVVGVEAVHRSTRCVDRWSTRAIAA